MLVNFVLLADEYRKFRMALNSGDAMMIECLYRDFLPIFYLTKKKHYTEIILTQIDTFYKKIGPQRLQLVRINRTVPLYGGYDKQGVPMANWSLDGIIELIQKYYHQMKFTTEKGWSTHLPHLMLTNKATRYAQIEYNRLSSKSEKDDKWINLSDDINPMNNRSKTAVSCRAKEHLAIANYLNLVKAAIKIPGQKYNKTEFVRTMEKVEVWLEDEDEDARARRQMKEARSEDEGVMAGIIEELFDTAKRDNDNDNGHRNRSLHDLNVELNAATLARGGEDLEDDLDKFDNQDGNVNENVGNSEIIIATIQRPLKIRLANVNELCFIDVRTAGCLIMEKSNPRVTRFNRNERMTRKMKFYEDTHKGVTNNDSDGGNEDIFEVVFNRFINN